MADIFFLWFCFSRFFYHFSLIRTGQSGLISSFVFNSSVSFVLSVLASTPVCAYCVSVRGLAWVCLPLAGWVFMWCGVLCEGRQDVRCLSARSGRWKAAEGVEVACCRSGNRMSSQKFLSSSVLLPSAFPVGHEETPITSVLLHKITQHLLRMWHECESVGSRCYNWSS